MNKDDIPVSPRFLFPGDQPSFGRDLKRNRLRYLRIGRVTRVDYERGYLDINWVDANGGRSNVMMPAAYSSARGTVQGMPEVGSYVVCGWIRLEQNIERPIVLNFLDLDLEGSHGFRLYRGKASKDLETISSIREKIGYDSIRHKRRKLYPGEISTESTQGAEVFLDDNVYISDSRMSEIELNSFDQSIRMSSLQQYTSTEAARTWNGMITRVPLDSVTGTFGDPTVYGNGQQVHIVTDSQNPYHLGGRPFTEYRIEVFEKGDGVININEVNSGYDVTRPIPAISSVMGTVVGNDKNNISRYAKVLRPQVFGSPYATEPTVDDMQCLPEEYESLASVFQLKLGTGTKIDIDKQGHLFTHFTASTTQHPLGQGRSWEANFDGSVKWVVGSNTTDGQSIVIDTVGSIKETLGTDNSQRSKETIAQKALYTEVMEPDESGNAYYLNTTGNVVYDITGDFYVDISGDYRITVSGKITEEILGSKTTNYLNDHNVVYGGSYKETVVKDKQVTIGENREVTIAGTKNNVPSPPTITTDKLSLTTGTLEIETLLGNIKVNSLTQKVEISGTLGVKLSSGVKIEALAPMVDIGQIPTRGGVVTGTPGTASHYDYITGSPLVGSASVSASSF